MQTTRIVLASRNAGKARELMRLLGESRLELVPMSELVPDSFEVAETEDTFEGNAWLKALALCEQTGLAAIADDSGLEVDALGGRPGVYSARYAGNGASDAANNELLLAELGGRPPEQRSACFRCALVLAVPGPNGPEKRAATSGVVWGRILMAPRGQHGFGYDPLFEPLETPGLTTAEMEPEQKNALSHRGRAAALLAPFLGAWLDSLCGPRVPV